MLTGPERAQVVALTDLGLGSAEDAGAIAASGDAVSISLADGVIVDWSVVGEPCALAADLCPPPSCEGRAGHPGQVPAASGRRRATPCGWSARLLCQQSKRGVRGCHCGPWPGAGGTVSFDREANAEVYGPEATTESLLSEQDGAGACIGCRGWWGCVLPRAPAGSAACVRAAPSWQAAPAGLRRSTRATAISCTSWQAAQQ